MNCPQIRLRRHTDGHVAVSVTPQLWRILDTSSGSLWATDDDVAGPGWSELLVAELPEPDSEDADVWTTDDCTVADVPFQMRDLPETVVDAGVAAWLFAGRQLREPIIISREAVIAIISATAPLLVADELRELADLFREVAGANPDMRRYDGLIAAARYAESHAAAVVSPSSVGGSGE